ncbi:MAG: alpha-mannosidase [Anaerolineae bacterium]|nr:alpha-mannosidase [Anaerolineae bacterium]
MLFFTVEKIEKQLVEIREAVYREVVPIRQFAFREEDVPGAEAPDYDEGDWERFEVGQRWGGYDVIAWFRARVPIPAGWNERRLYLRFLVGPREGGGSTAETMLYVNGEALQGIDVWHEEAWLPPEHLQGDEIVVALRAWSGVLAVPESRQFKLAQLLWIDETTEKLFHLSRVLLEAIRELEEGDLRRVRLLQALNDAYYRLDFSEPRSEAFYDSAAAATAYLQGQLEMLQGRDTSLRSAISAVGHAHIDMAWLWRLQHSREKAGRTFATALHLMRQYPEYRFMHSSPQLYEFLESDYPEIFARVKERIAAGQWEITGGMWIESDINIPSGESLVRQFLLGQQYMRDTFGVESNLLWLPDVFGYSWSLPQIARKSGIKYFLTSKISWNQFNRFPYDTFLWRGIDGTELLGYFVTTPGEGTQYTYNGLLSPHDIKGTWEQYRQKEINEELLTLYGFGDGGGGPTKEMLESGRVLADLPGFPCVRQGTAEPFFERLAQRLADKSLPVWDGELYLEYHRGTYTSQAYNKWANRKAEILYHNAELFSAVAALLASDYPYPAGQLRDGWKLLLLNQFHDILPGSSIRQVYEDSREDYERIFACGDDVVAAAQAELQAGLALEEPAVVVYNGLSWARGGLVSLPASGELAGKRLLGPDGKAVPAQEVGGAGERRTLCYIPQVPSLGYAVYRLGEGQTAAEDTETLTVTPALMENRFVRLELNERGQLTSIWDKVRQREVLAPGARGNVLQTFMDKPLKFDAWDIDIFYQEKMQEIDELVEATVEETGPLRGVLRLRWRFHGSTVTQRLTLYAHAPRIDFRTEVDWQQAQILLKVAFPVEVRAARATYDIQFGAIERPTHWNTSWDYARFEVAGHKWADLSEGDYGVALLNDSKYGYDVKDNVLRLTLIKSAVRPDALADKGRHQFTYSLLPHAGDWRDVVVRQGYELNHELIAAPVVQPAGGDLPLHFSLAAVDADHVILETVKQAEDGDGWIVRCYETQQRRSPAVTIRTGRPLQRAVACNLVEEAEEPAAVEGDKLTFPIRPFEIRTFKVWFA